MKLQSTCEHRHGGARPGSGRPKKDDKSKNRTFRATDTLWETAKILSEKEGKTRTVWITELIQREIDKMKDAISSVATVQKKNKSQDSKDTD